MNGGNSSSMKCPSCGLVNWATAADCKRCKTPFAQGGSSGVGDGNSHHGMDGDALSGDRHANDDGHPSMPHDSAGWSPSPPVITTYGQQGYGNHHHHGAAGGNAQNHLDIEFEVSPFVRATTTFRDTSAMLSANFKTYAKIVMVAVAPIVLLMLATSTGLGMEGDFRSAVLVMAAGKDVDPVNLGATFLSIIAYHFITLAVLPGALIYGVVTKLNTGESPSVIDCFSWGLRRSLSTITTLYLCGLVLIIGYLCLVLPGLFLTFALSLVLPVVIIEGCGPVKAIKRSYQLTKGRKWNIFCSFFLWGLMIMAIALGAGFFAGLLMMVSTPLGSIAHIIASELLDSTGTLIALVIYLGLAYEGQYFHADAPAAQTPAQQWA